MRIAFLHQANDPYTEVRINYFINNGHEVHSLVFNNKVKQKTIKGLHVTAFPPILVDKLVKRFAYFSFIRAFTIEKEIDILYIISALNSYYLKASKANYNFLEIQGSDVITGPGKFPFLKYFYKTFWKYAYGITQDSELAKQKAIPYLPEKIINETIEIGVDFSAFNAKVEEGIVRKKYSLGNRPIIFHSRNSSKQFYNHDIIIKSIPIVKKYFDNVCYMFTGSINDLSKASKNLIHSYNLSNNIIFCGRLDHQTEMKYYNADADLMVSIPSSDSSPFSVYEAMATKTPVIVSDLPWLQGKFIPGEHLLTVKPRDELGLASSIIELLNKDVTLDIESSYSIVFERINMLVENRKLETLFANAIASKN